METFYKLCERVHIKRENILPLIISIVITAVAMFDSTYFNSRLLILFWAVTGIMFIGLIWFIFLKASFTVLRSFFFLNAELSLMIFLAKSYCEVPNHMADNELRIFVGISLFYIYYEFFKKLKEALKVRLESVAEKEWSREKIIIVGLFLFFLILFINTIYQVINPIIFSLCIYK